MPPQPPTAAKPGLSSEQTVTGMVLCPRHHPRNRRRSFGTLTQDRATPSSTTAENDGDDAEDNDDDVLLAC